MLFLLKKLTLCLLFTMFIISCSNIRPNTYKRNNKWAKEITSSSLNNLYKINDSIYRSEQPTKKEFGYLKELEYKSILNLRSTHLDSNYVSHNTFQLFTVKITTTQITDENIIASLKIIKSAKKPLLIHCKHGSDRTGLIVAMYRIIYENWSKEDAIDELINGSYGFHRQYANIPTYIRNVNIINIKKALSHL